MTWAAIGAILAGLGVALGAFGAHALKKRVTEDRVAIWNTGVQYHLIHAVALVAIAPLPIATSTVSMLFAAGIAIFSGSLYALVLTDLRKLGAVTPLGGLAFIAAWIMLALELL